ncbi:MAG: hypothetical protein WB643_06170 [Candidatus Bathyarchaeia archaeon]
METDWREMFRVELAEEKTHFETDPGDCNANCLEAKELICVCRCGGKNHGAALKKHVQPLDQFNEPEELEVEVIAA